MKKLYTVLALATVCATAYAAAPQRSTTVSMPKHEVSYAKSSVAAAANLQKAAKKAAPRAAVATADIAGEYDVDALSYLSEAGVPSPLYLEVVDEVAGEVEISGFPEGLTVTAYYDETSGTLSIDNNQYLGIDSYGDSNYFLLGGVSDNRFVVSSETAVEGTVDGGVITFPSTLLWAIGEVEAGFWTVIGDVVLTKYVAPENPNAGWTSLGNATFEDGWVMPLIGDQTLEDNWYEVELQQNDENPNVYRLVNPYGPGTPMYNYNASERTGYIQFDVTDPDHVVFAAVDACFVNSQMGLGGMYCMNALTMLAGYYEITPEAVIATVGDDIPYTTYKDGVVTLTATLATGGAYDNDACFGIPGDIYGGYQWQTSVGAANMEAKIIFPGHAPEPVDPNEGWTSLGNATLQDGWALPAYGIDQLDEANWYEVELQQNDENENVYRLVNPYKGESPLASYNTCTKDGYIQFDVTDPDHVVFGVVTAGLTLSQLGVNNMYCYNVLTFGMNYLGLTADEIIARLGNQIPYTTFNNGVLTLPAELTAEGYDDDACFGIPGDVAGGYTWTNPTTETPANMATKVWFPDANEGEGAVAGVEADNTDAPVEYFNLQGMRINQPAAGQVVIRRQGTEVIKEFKNN